MLTAEQARFFARNGFLQLKGCVPAAVCAHLVESTWRQLPPRWRRDDPSSWTGLVEDACHVAGLGYRGGLLKLASGSTQARKDLIADPMVVASFHAPAPCHEAAHDLVGTPLHPIRVRGLYAIAPVPEPDAYAEAVSPHVEAHPAQIIALTYLEEVAPGGGGLLVWPGSHRPLYAAFESRLDYVEGPTVAATVAAQLQWRPVELPGDRGDVVFIHHRLLHSPSINRRDRIRFGFLCDYTPRNHRELCRLPPAGMWDDWPGLVRLAGAQALDGEPDFDREPALARRRRRVAAKDGTLSSTNKSDASRIARARRPGDVWISIADTPELFESDERLDPHGGRLVPSWRGIWTRGIVVASNGEVVTSMSQGGFTAKLAAREGRNVVEVRGIRGPLWLRVIQVAAPFSASRALVRLAIDGTHDAVECDFVVESAGAGSIGSL